MMEQMSFATTEDYQDYLKERQELLAYCKKISQGIENLDEKSGERAIWELIQNARDMDDNCRIRIELNSDSIVFFHHGKPFDYISLLALVNQNSSKDNPGADLAGQYGTGFMTTHAFSDVVVVDGPYKVVSNPNTIDGYVELDGFELNRSYCSTVNDVEQAIFEMRKEMKRVKDMWRKRPIYTELPDKWTSFKYKLDTDRIENVSKQLEDVVRFIPFVLIINERIKEVEIINNYANKHFKIQKSANVNYSDIEGCSSWQVVDNNITYTYFDNTQSQKLIPIRSLQSKDGYDVIILPPFPKESGCVSNIPSLFLWFPLLGTELFGVNFIFHSKRFHPVEKRNNILLPENVPSKISKGRENEKVLREMMSVLFDYYKQGNNDTSLTREMCIVNFHSDKEDEETIKFYEGLQQLWNVELPKWKVIPTIDGNKAISDYEVRVLHPDFYRSLSAEQKRKYELVLDSYVQQITYNGVDKYLLPKSDLIGWSETVNQWRCENNSDFFVTVKDVCRSIDGKSHILHNFLSFLNDSGNSSLMDEYELLPNRHGILKRKGELSHGDFMTPELYTLTELLMGNDASKMIDTAYNDIVNVSSYKPENLQNSINQTVGQWRRCVLGENKSNLTDKQLNALIAFCSATSQDEFTNYRGRMMSHIVKIHNKSFNKIVQKKLIDKEEEFYNPAFHLLLDYTLYIISTKDSKWAAENKDILKGFLLEYSNSNSTDRLSRLDDYAVIPNNNKKLCTKKELLKNIDIDSKLAEIYRVVTGVDLNDKWVANEFADIFIYAEHKATDVANEIQTKLNENDFQDTIVLDIIELAENGIEESNEKWKALFKIVYAQRESIRYKLGTPEERKAINRIMKKKNPSLLTMMADIAEREDAQQLIFNIDNIITQLEHDAHIKMLGAYAERHIFEYLTTALADVDVNICNQQGGQDFIIKKEGVANYYIEVKSRWESEQSVEMTTEQFRRAVDNPDSYALISLNLYHYDQNRAKRNDPMLLSEVFDKIKVLDNIGYLEADLRKRTEEAFRGDYRDIRLNGSYKVCVPQNIFDSYPLSFDDLIEKLKQRFK